MENAFSEVASPYDYMETSALEVYAIATLAARFPDSYRNFCGAFSNLETTLSKSERESFGEALMCIESEIRARGLNAKGEPADPDEDESTAENLYPVFAREAKAYLSRF